MKYLASSFSLQMLPEGGTVNIIPLTEAEFVDGITQVAGNGYTVYFERAEKSACGVSSCIGHEGTANAVETILRQNKVKCDELDRLPHETASYLFKRVAITLSVGDVLYVAQPTGKRIEYGKEVDFPELSFFGVMLHRCRACKRQHVDEFEE